MPVTPIRPYCADDVPHLVEALAERLGLDAVAEQLLRNLCEALQQPSDR